MSSGSKPVFSALLLPSLVLAAAACGAGSNTDSDAAPDDDVLEVRGTWRVSSGVFFAPPGFDQIDFIQFDAEEGSLAGSGVVYGQSELGAQSCGAVLFAQFGDGSLSVSAPPIGNTSFYGVRANGPDELTVTAADGSETVLERVETVPEEAQCQKLAVSKMLALPEEPSSFSGIGDDGVLLWYEGRGESFISIDPATDALGSLKNSSFGSFTHIQAVQNSAFWMHCGCGGSQEAMRFSKDGTEQLTIDTTKNLPMGLSVRSVAIKGTGEVVVAGNDRQNGVPTLLVFNSAGTTLLDTIESEQAFSGIGFRGDELWYSIFTPASALVQMDAQSKRVVRTIQMPEGMQLRSFVFRNDTVFAIASDSTNQHFLLQGEIK